MMASKPDFDVAVVGASLAGCAAATLLAREGARVALIERKPDPAAFKRVCGHYIQPSALPVLERLGLMGRLRKAGAHRGRGRVWTSAGWIGEGGRESLPEALSARREVLDPMIRRLASDTPGVEARLGATLDGLEREGERMRVRLRSGDELTARLVVGADGRGSQTAKLAGLAEKRSENLRFCYAGYFEGPPLEAGVAVRLWFLEPDVAIVTPTDAGLMLYVAMPHRDRIPEFKRDPEAALRAFFAAVPDPPPLAESTFRGPMVGKLDMTNESRTAVGDGVALIGDAALAADPVAAIGCGWALQSGEWLADEVTPALAGERSLPSALKRYARRHRRELSGHARLLAEFARKEELSPIQRLLFTAAVHDEQISERLGAYAGRLIRPSQLLTPRTLGRAATIAVKGRRRNSPHPEEAPGLTSFGSGVKTRSTTAPSALGTFGEPPPRTGR